jgi:predicted metal-dependent hydrolase
MTVNHPILPGSTTPGQLPAFDRHYIEFFDCFNQQRYFEAHEVLEQLWLPSRGGPQDLFYKGLIQLAGAFVHLQKRRQGPAAALLRRAGENLAGFPAVWENLDLTTVRSLIGAWLARLDPSADMEELIRRGPRPSLQLQG